MESTGVYWRPVWNVLEGRFEIRLANAQHIGNLPGKKTDRKDGEWIAKLLQYDLEPASFVPPTPIRQLRDLTRTRVRLVEERAAVANRIQRILEDANIKLASVAMDVLGYSGRRDRRPCRAVPHGRPLGVMGGTLPWQQREWGKVEIRQDSQGQCLAAPGLM